MLIRGLIATRRSHRAAAKVGNAALFASRSLFTTTSSSRSSSRTHLQSSSSASAMGMKSKHVRMFSNFTEIVPGLGDSISDAVVIEWTKNPGDYVFTDDVVCILETDKVSVDIKATKNGKIVSVNAEEGDTVNVGQDLLVLDTAAAAPEGGAQAEAPSSSAPPPPPTSAAPAAAPATPAAAAAPVTSAAASPAAPATSGPCRTENSVPLSRMRLTIAKRLKDAQNTAAMLTTFNEIDMSAIMDLRSKHKDEFLEKHGCKLGFMSIFVKASTNALMRSPNCNAFFDIENKCTTYRDFVDISVAVSTPTGLVVPVLRNTETMSFAGVEGAIADLGKRAKAGKIGMEDMVGGTFTITNGGVFGSLMGTPILNPPQTAVLGMHGIFKRPVVVGNEIQIRPMMYVALTYDHRILDGSDAVKFLRDIKNQVEDPSRILFDI